MRIPKILSMASFPVVSLMKLSSLILNFSSFLCFSQLLEVQYLQRKMRLAEFEDFYSLGVLTSYLNDT